MSGKPDPAVIATRLPRAAGDEAAKVRFRFDGREIEGLEGEPVAVALLAAGVRVFRSMPESGEPRGGFCFTGRCADCLMVIDGVSGVRACMTLLRDGMTVETQYGLGVALPGISK